MRKKWHFEPTVCEEFQTHQFALGYSETEWKEELTYVKKVKGSDIQNKQSEFCFLVFLNHCSIFQWI